MRAKGGPEHEGPMWCRGTPASPTVWLGAHAGELFLLAVPDRGPSCFSRPHKSERGCSGPAQGREQRGCWVSSSWLSSGCVAVSASAPAPRSNGSPALQSSEWAEQSFAPGLWGLRENSASWWAV